MKAAVIKMITLKISTISPTDLSILLPTYNARISVPSRTLPPLIDNPTPAPRNNPPKMAMSNLSYVIMGNLITARTIDKPTIAMNVLIAKIFEIWL